MSEPTEAGSSQASASIDYSSIFTDTSAPQADNTQAAGGACAGAGYDGHERRAGTIIHRGSSSTDSSQGLERGESWSDFLRRSAPQDIISRHPNDPVRQAYIQQRKTQALEEARKRRRGATASSMPTHRLPPPPPLPRQPTNPNGSWQQPWTVQPRPRPQPQPYNLPQSSNSANMNINRPLPGIPVLQPPQDTPGNEYVVPKWQPDSDASACPICNRTFSMFFRRHHCRKCGRVVCAACSPHRITIPRQFIVHPPDDLGFDMTSANGLGREIVDLTGDDENEQSGDGTINPALGGGLEVRLCNPCVPDPNPLPPPTYPPFVSGAGFASFPAPGNGPPLPLPNSMHQRYLGYGQHPQFPGNTPVHAIRYNAPYSAVPSNPSSASSVTRDPRTAQSPYGSAPTGSSGSYFSQPQYVANPLPPSNRNHTPRHRTHASTSFLPARHQPIHNHNHNHNRNPNPLPPSPPPPPPPVREEDECPICHDELPPKGDDGSETAREAHIVECIESHSNPSGPRPISQVQSNTDVPESASSSANAGSETSRFNSSSALAGSASSSLSNPAMEGSSSSSSNQPRPRRRTTGMVVYQATEKDCVGNDGGQQECVICFEEFEVGNEMGRLECLCKFHRFCIRQWWERKGPGSCPVHQGGI